MKKYLLRYGIITILILILIPLLPAFISSLQKTQITADIHKIEKASTPYMFKYRSSTFDLQAGEKNGSPNFKVSQIKRSLDFDVIVDSEPASSSRSLENNDFGQLNSFVTAMASEDIKVVDENTDPAIEYQKVNESSDFILNPDQDKIEISWELLSQQDLPKLQFETEKLIPRKEGDSIIFYTRTFRKAFELKKAKLTTNNESKPVELNLTESNDIYNISFSISYEAQYPSTLSANLVSLFHERLIYATPTDNDFSVFEKPEFIIDMGEVEEPMKSALMEKDYTNVKFGIIDATGQGHQVPAELIDKNGKTIIRFTKGGSFKPGLYDLLVQYKNEPSFIGTEEFSWGVLAMNPDQAVYKSGQTAKIDMAVLDHLGRIVCDAQLNISITNPSGGVTTLSTNDGSIKTTPGCFQKETDLPDYTTTYKTTTEGNYLINLSAKTQNGQYSISDKFVVDDNSPFYVKRSGPTRIFPPKTYEMKIEIEANQNAAEIIEKVPTKFITSEIGEFERDGGNLSWAGNINSGQNLSLSYKFNTPPISPAFYQLGPLKISKWEEPRTWQLAIDDNDYIDPNGDGTIAGNPVTCGGGGNYDCLDEQTRQPTAPSDTSGDYVDFDSNEADFYDMTTLSVSSVSQIDVYVYHIERKNNMFLEVSLFDTDEITQYGSVTDLTQRLTAQWDSVTFGSLTLTQGQLNDLNVRLRCYKNGGGSPDDCEAYAMYGYVTYSPPAAGPTNDQLLRHGTWFDSGVEQPMTF